MRLPEICFYPSDDVEKSFIKPMFDELISRGFEPAIDITMSKKSVLGIFLSHNSKNRPNLAQKSIIMLHDLGQAHNIWPFFWRREPWGRYDYGILPNKFWGDMYREQFVNELLSTIKSAMLENQDLSSFASQTDLNFQFESPFFPKNGVEILGWPKYDLDEFFEKKKKYYEKNGSFEEQNVLNILYAPSWEYNNQQDKLIKSIVDLPVKIFIKQQHWLGDGGVHMARVEEMASLHENCWENVVILDPTTDIFDALVSADCIISDESSTLTEGLMVGVLPIAISDWLVPDTSPPRQASVPYPYVTKIKECEIREKVQELLRPQALEKALKSIELDLVDSVFADKPVKAVTDFVIKIFDEHKVSRSRPTARVAE